MRLPFRGVITFLLIWAILWAVPALKVQNFRALHPEYAQFWEMPQLTEAQLANATKENPNDSFLQSQLIQLDMRLGTAEGIERFFRDYDALIARHPDNVALWRNRLRLSSRGSLVSPNFTHQLVQGMQQAPWLDRKGVEKVVAQARAAQKVDPNEALFPWVEAMALWGLGRKQESIQAMEKAGRCPRFDDGALEEVRQKSALVSRLQPMDWDDKLGATWGALFPHLAGMRALTREVAASGTEHFRAKDRAEAWRRWEITIRAGRGLRTAQSRGANSTLIGLLVGEAIEQTAWDIAARGAGNYNFKPRRGAGSTLEESLRRSQESLLAFDRVAKRDGHPELAKWVAQDGHEIAARRASLTRGGNWTEIFDRGIGWKTPVARATLQIRWVGFYAIQWALVGVAAWLLSILLSRGGRDTCVGKNTVALLSAFLGVFWIGLAVLAMSDGAGVKSYAKVLEFGAEDSYAMPSSWGINWDWNFWWAVAGTFVAAAIGREWGARRMAVSGQGNRDKTRLPLPPFWKVAGFAAWTLCLLLSLCLWFDATNQRGLDGMETLLWFCWAASVCLGLLSAWQNQKDGDGKGQSPLFFAITTALALGVFILSGRTHYSDAAFWWCIVLCPLTLALFVWNGRHGFWSRGRIATNLETGARVLASVSLLISAGYLIASLALLPARQQLNARVDRYVQMGEIDWLNTQMR